MNIEDPEVKKVYDMIVNFMKEQLVEVRSPEELHKMALRVDEASEQVVMGNIELPALFLFLVLANSFTTVAAATGWDTGRILHFAEDLIAAKRNIMAQEEKTKVTLAEAMQVFDQVFGAAAN